MRRLEYLGSSSFNIAMGDATKIDLKRKEKVLITCSPSIDADF